MKKNNSGFKIDYKFKSPKSDKQVVYSYDVPLKDYVAGIIDHFNTYNVLIDGSGNHIIEALSDLGAIKGLEDSAYFIDFLTERCRHDAQEEMNWKYELEELEDED